MLDRAPRRRRPWPRRLALTATTAAFLAAAGAVELYAKLETWRQESAAAFAKHKRDGVVISDQGRIRLGRALIPTPPLAAERVWDLARGADGSVYAATGDSGLVFRLPPGANPAAWEQAWDDADGQALALAATPDGKVYVGTGPSGRVVELTDPAHPSSRPDPGVLYIWDLAADAKGNLFAATGPNGQLWKRDPAGSWSLVYDAKPAHLLCVAVGPDGSIFAGSDGEGLVYKIAPDGKATVLYDAPQSEVRTLLALPDGSVYAGTAADSGGASNRGAGLFSAAGPEARIDAEADGARTQAVALAQVPAVDATAAAPKDAPAAGGGSATIKPPQPGENAVYRIDREGLVREVFRVKAMIFALAKLDGRLLVGTGPEGVLYEVREADSESTPLAKLDNGQILALMAAPDGEVWIGAGDPGAVVRSSAHVVEQGTLTSDVFDAKLPSRFGSLDWRAETPEGTSVAIQVRTGNVGEPDATWSDWSPEQADAASAQANAPTGRFVQYRVKLATKDPARTPELRSVAIAYRSTNLPPEIEKLEIPDVSTADGAARKTRLNIRWDVSDPNDDELNFLVQVRKDGWPSWIALTDAPITQKTYEWDASAFPSGRYQVRLIAGDRPSNSPEEALTRERDSTAFLVDHGAPRVTITSEPGGRKATIALGDELTRLVKAEYAVDGGAWASIFPDDGLFDGTSETCSLALPDLKPGVHLLMVRATDAAGNVGAGDLILTVKD